MYALRSQVSADQLPAASVEDPRVQCSFYHPEPTLSNGRKCLYAMRSAAGGTGIFIRLRCCGECHHAARAAAGQDLKDSVEFQGSTVHVLQRNLGEGAVVEDPTPEEAAAVHAASTAAAGADAVAAGAAGADAAAAGAAPPSSSPGPDSALLALNLSHNMHSVIWPRLRQRLVELGDGHALEEVDPQGGVTPVSGRTLLSMAGQVAAELAALARPGAGPPTAGLFLTNSAVYVAAALGALQAGWAFLPLDPRWPRQRLQQVVALSQAPAVLFAPEEATGGHGRPAVEGCRLVRAPAAADRLPPAPPPPGQAEELGGPEAQGGVGQPLPFCYVIFTSGSTGAPLGVLGTEEGILNRCSWMEASRFLEAGHRVAFKTSPCFVDSIWEVFGPLLAGARIVTVPQSIAANPAALCGVVVRTKVTHLAAVPTVWQALLQHLEGEGEGSGGLSTLRLAVSSGEPLPAALLQSMQTALPRCRLFNLYGSTEVAADCTWLDCSAQSGRAAAGGGQPGVGYPISETLVAVMDPGEASAGRWSLQTPGRVGEVFVAGSGLAAGYLGAPEETRRRFVSVPAACLAQVGKRTGAEGSLPAVRCFRTGDLGAFKAGCLHLEGRVDLQVKVAGARVDLTEVEAALAAHPAVEAAAAKVWPLSAGEALVGYVQLSPGCTAPDAAVLERELQAACRERLPRAAVPGQVLLLPRLPRTSAGKLERSALQRPNSAARPRKRSAEEVAEQAAAPAGGASGSRQAPSELVISRAFARALSSTGFEATQSIFILGGNSLTAAQIANDLGVEPAVVIAHPTVRSLAAYLRGGAGRGGAGAAGAASAAGSSQPAALQGLAAGARPLQAGEPPRGAWMRLAWRAEMLACIDAAPLAGDLGGRPAVFACSHRGDVGCWDAASGQRVWEVRAGGRADAGLALCQGLACPEERRRQYLAVGTTDGDLVFVDLERQQAWGRVAIGGALRAAPAVDPWPSCGLVWAVTHASELVVVAAPGQVVARRRLPSPASAPVAFDEENCLAYVACLDGTLVATSVRESTLQRCAAKPPRLPALGDPVWRNSPMNPVPPAWQHECSEALMAPPLVVPGRGGAVVLAAAVDGSLVALRPDDGAVAWQLPSLNSAVFSPMLLAEPGYVLVGLASGALHGVKAESGAAAALCNLGSSVTGMAQPAPGQAVVCTAAGVVFWLDVALLRQQTEGAECGAQQTGPAAAAVLDRVQLPGEVFAAPAVGQGWACIGCRDNHLYSISLGDPPI